MSRLYAQTITRQSPQMFCTKSGGELDFPRMVHDLKIDTTIALSPSGNPRIWYPQETELNQSQYCCDRLPYFDSRLEQIQEEPLDMPSQEHINTSMSEQSITETGVRSPSIAYTSNNVLLQI